MKQKPKCISLKIVRCGDDLTYEKYKSTIDIMKTCTKCEQEFPATKEYFYTTGKKYLNSYCKTCAKKYVREWSKNNKDKAKEYYQANREEILAYNKQYQIENKEKIRAYKKEWYLKRKANG